LLPRGASVVLLSCKQDAASHNRLGSDTYKRLNLGVMYQSIVVIVLFIRHKGLMPEHVFG
jgi:hypothetical protein